MVKIPKLKRDVSKFVLSEEGKISKQSILVVGAFLTSAVSSGVLLSQQVAGYMDHSNNPPRHTNSAGLSYSEPTATANHTHHQSHQNYNFCVGKC